MNEKDIEDVVDRSVRKTLTALGIDVSSTESIIQTQVDMAYLRRARSGAEEVTKWTKRSVIGAAITALLYVIWSGVLQAIHR